MNSITFTEENYEKLTAGMHWNSYEKQIPIKAVRIGAPFYVKTSNGLFFCEDGWLCIDARGYPYAIDDEEFQLIYQVEGKG